MAVADVTGDATADILTGNGCCRRAINVWAGGVDLGGAADVVIDAPDGSANFNEIDEYSLCDIDGDGKSELLTGNASSVSGYVWFGGADFGGEPDRTYSPGSGLNANATGYVHGVCMPDFTGDGTPDIAFIARSGAGTVTIRH